MKGPDKQTTLESQGLYLLEVPCPQGLLESLKIFFKRNVVLFLLSYLMTALTESLLLYAGFF